MRGKSFLQGVYQVQREKGFMEKSLYIKSKLNIAHGTATEANLLQQ
jgi:hypothetical protein